MQNNMIRIEKKCAKAIVPRDVQSNWWLKESHWARQSISESQVLGQNDWIYKKRAESEKVRTKGNIQSLLIIINNNIDNANHTNKSQIKEWK
jgi:hypothetical protein